MTVLVDVHRLEAEGVLTPDQVEMLRARGRETLVRLAVGVILTGGVVAATVGLILWLADPRGVALGGVGFLALGWVCLTQGTGALRPLGNAITVIGAGMLTGGAALELMVNNPALAGPVLLPAGLALAGAAAGLRRARRFSFVGGAVFLMGIALHLVGGGWLLEQAGVQGWPMPLAALYAAVLIAGAGALVNVRFVTALAIVPFAQILDTQTVYSFARYSFFSPEPTLSILQMAALTLASFWLAGRVDERWGRHALTLGMMGFVVGNLSALVGAHWGDAVGAHLWGQTLLTLSPGFYAIAWAVLLAATIATAAHRGRRGLFNAAITFAAIHAYTELFLSLSAHPQAFAIGGLAALPFAWGLWRLDRWMAIRAA